MVGTIIPICYLFIFFLGFSLFVCCTFVSLFLRPKRSMQLRNIDFSKEIGLEL